MCSLEQTSHMASGLAQDLGRRCCPRGSAAPGYRPCHTSAGSHQPPLLQILSPAGIWGVLCSGGQDSRINHHLSRGILIFLPHWDTAENRKNYPAMAGVNWPVHRELYVRAAGAGA